MREHLPCMLSTGSAAVGAAILYYSKGHDLAVLLAAFGLVFLIVLAALVCILLYRR